MAIKLRLARHGAKKRPYYRIVVADVRAPRDGRYIERVGSYNPLLGKDDPNRVQLDEEKVKEWLGKGARPTERVARFLGAAGLWEWKAGNNPDKGKPGAKAEQMVKDKAEKEERTTQERQNSSRCYATCATSEEKDVSFMNPMGNPIVKLLSDILKELKLLRKDLKK